MAFGKKNEAQKPREGGWGAWARDLERERLARERGERGERGDRDDQLDRTEPRYLRTDERLERLERFERDQRERDQRERDQRERREQDSDGIDWPKMFVTGSALAVAAWAAWQLRQKFVPQENINSPGSSSSNFVSPTAAGSMSRFGDLVLVSASIVSDLMPGVPASLKTLKVRVKSATPRSGPMPPNVLVQIEDANWPYGNSLPPFPVPRSSIVQVVSTQTTTRAPSSSPFEVPALSEPQHPEDQPVPHGPVFLGNPLPVRQNMTYRARLALSGLEAAFATPMLVAQKFEEIGFEDILVWQHARDLPADWPLSERGPEGQGMFFLEGTWRRGDENVPRPPQIASAWEA